MNNGYFLYSIVLTIGTLAPVAFPQPAGTYVIGATFMHPTAKCPYYVAGLVQGAPADQAGLKEGDELIEVNGKAVENLPMGEVVKLIKSNRQEEDVTLTVRRHGDVLKVTVGHEDPSTVQQKQEAALARIGMKVLSHSIVPADATEAEVRRMESFDGSRLVTQIFPLHYPSDPAVYYGGFEAFVLRSPAEVTVGGIEDGPAARAGLHWGDILVEIDGVNPAMKSVPEVTALLSGQQSRRLYLTIDRLGTLKRIEFTLVRTDELLRQNGLQLVAGRTSPTFLDRDYPKCFQTLP